MNVGRVRELEEKLLQLARIHHRSHEGVTPDFRHCSVITCQEVSALLAAREAKEPSDSALLNREVDTEHDWIICRDCCEAWPYDARNERSCECVEDHKFVVSERAREQEAERPDAEALAQRFHETYERLAPEYGYKTREAVAWDDVPDIQKALMIGVCRHIQGLVMIFES